MSDAKKYDVVVYGATSFVGQLICQYLIREYGTGGEINWAIAGRSKQKLSQLVRQLGPPAEQLPVIIADAHDENALATLCLNSKVILTTVGPYAHYGETLVKTCAENGTDYVDLTGEAHWIRAMLEKYEQTAKQNGARIVHCCGFDSIPSDLGVYFLQQQAQARFSEPCEQVQCRVKAMRGGFSGGTVASIINIVRAATKDKALRKVLGNPYALCLDGPKNSVKQHDVKTPTYNKNFQAWTAPFIMAGINTRIVHRTNMLLDMVYGNTFKYDEAMLTGDGPKGWAKAQAITAAMGGFLTSVALKPSRWLLEKYVLPAPGEGPSPEAQEKGFFDIRFFGKTQHGKTLVTKVTGDRDPGYGATAKMITEAAICLVKDIPSTEKAGGFWTPATVFGHTLIQRLEEKAGMRFEVL